MNYYPTRLDEIDQWLADNFGIIPGACSSTENLRHTTARMIAEALWPKNEKAESGDSKTSNDLEEAADNAWCDYTYKSPPAELYSTCFRNGFIAGAKWQKEQYRDACRQCKKGDDIAFYKGVQFAIETMKEDAIERIVKEDAGGYPYIDEIELYDYDNDEPTAKKGDKVWVYIFKN